ncbi:hypothetical protein ACG5V6_03735 [Streptomyces chitinivorans]|uniref:Uncharacterized protein n=1 Tax=Streptomyces chitinivorans TaxID=1257027 RepID=A0ABW7HN83_9ACTN|nr:hypothetical protein [Streptomyces chitinivorans]MDH2411117.1 hypothetical protein [Streptomyces chitinivorans]
MKGGRPRGWGWLVWLLVPVVLAGCGRRGGNDHDDARLDPSVSASARPDDDGEGPDIGDLPVPDVEIGSGGATGDQGSGSGGAGDTETEPEPEPTDPTQEAFRAVVRGTCLPVYRDGDDWNTSVPPDAVSCRSERAGLFEVTRTVTGGASCPTGTGRDRWSHHSSVTGETTTLCLNRVWVKDYCVLAEQSGDTITSVGASTAVDCSATEVPVPYNQVLVVAAVYRAPAGAGASHCRTGAHDNRRYWSLLADGGATLVCFTSRS